MAANFNQITIIGRVGKDPEIKTTDTSMKVAKFTVATSEKTGTGENRHEETEWFNIAAFKAHAEIVERFLRKGDLVMLQGRLKTRDYQDKAGEMKKYTEVLVNQIQLLQMKDPNREIGPAHERKHNSLEHHAEEVAAPIDDLPF